jgi:hypothetical protein
MTFNVHLHKNESSGTIHIYEIKAATTTKKKPQTLRGLVTSDPNYSIDLPRAYSPVSYGMKN